MSSVRCVPLGKAATIERETVEASDIRSGSLYVGLENIESGGRFINVRPVDAGELASNKFRFTSKHLLYGKLRPYLAKIARPNFDGICSTDIVPVLPGPHLDRGYLAWMLLTPALVGVASSRANGANLPRISPQTLAAIEIPLPPLAEQQRIAKILDSADALRAKRRAALAKLDTLTQSIFLDMFGDPSKDAKRWPEIRLGELIVDGPQNGLYKPATCYGSGTRILRIDGFYDGKVTDFETLKRVETSEAERNRYGLRCGDIVINRVNSREYLGKSALIPHVQEMTVFESNMMRFRVDEERVKPEFIIALLQSQYVRRQILHAAKDAVNQSSINQDDVAKMWLVVPAPTLQGAFAKKKRSAEALVARQQASSVGIESLFATLQHRAFRGEL